MRKVDKLGRIVIPRELRKKYGLNEGTAVEFQDSGFGVTIRAQNCFCRICNRPVTGAEALPLCNGCIMKAVMMYEKEKNG
ncbi:MAG: AbrB/MazE/SpoVT family DNA-binding domain-containing protein [Clostridia bacterium]|nr:AbrB/MazE/SpoVT family DNA-binding domain-containing protein [Clostridia bacterium]